MKQLVLYIHGKGGSAAEAEHYRSLFPQCDVVGLDYHAQTPWEAKEELPRLFDAYSAGREAVMLIANSIGAFFAMSALSEKRIDRALFISPIVDMERLILDMMAWANVTEHELQRRGEILTDLGEALSWDYLRYVRSHPLSWRIPTRILYGEKDALTAPSTVTAFAERIGAPLTVMPNGEHWFHTEEQMTFLDRWVKEASL